MIAFRVCVTKPRLMIKRIEITKVLIYRMKYANLVMLYKT